MNVKKINIKLSRTFVQRLYFVSFNTPNTLYILKKINILVCLAVRVAAFYLNVNKFTTIY